MENIIFWSVMVAIIIASYAITISYMTRDMRYDDTSWVIAIPFGLLGVAIGVGADAVIYFIFFYATELAKTFGITGFF